MPVPISQLVSYRLLSLPCLPQDAIWDRGSHRTILFVASTSYLSFPYSLVSDLLQVTFVVVVAVFSGRRLPAGRYRQLQQCWSKAVLDRSGHI